MIDSIVDTIQEKLSAGNELQLFGSDERRLAALGEFPDISYSALCTGTCWNNLQAAFQNSMSTLDSSTCKKKAKVKLTKKFLQKSGEAREEKRRRKSAGKGEGDTSEGERGSRRMARTDFIEKESTCIFDICPKIRIACNATNVTGPGRNDSSRIQDVYNNMDTCTASNINFLCNSVCSAGCYGDANMRKMLCGATGKAEGGKYDTDKNGGDVKKMFNMMCTSDPEGNYCYDKIKANIKANDFEVNRNAEAFPNPCTVDCGSTAATAVTNLGCCFPAVMDAQKRYKVMTKGQTRMLKAIAFRCGGNSSFDACTAGRLKPIKSKRVAISTNLSCADFSSESAEANFTELLTYGINGTSLSIEVLACVAKGEVCPAFSTTPADSTTTTDARRLYADDYDDYARRLEPRGSNSDLTLNLQGDASEVALATISSSLISDAEAAAETSDPASSAIDSGTNSGEIGGAFRSRPMLAVFGSLIAFLMIVSK